MVEERAVAKAVATVEERAAVTEEARVVGEEAAVRAGVRAGGGAEEGRG
jgi:hypothetical protein